MEDEDFKGISNKMNVMINLLMDMKENLGKEMSVKEKIIYLTRSGLGNKEVAKILGISEKHVSKEKSLVNKDGRKEIIRETGQDN